MSVSPPRELSKPIAAIDQRCAVCGYGLRGLTIARCPECGTPFEFDGHVLASIPWLQCRFIGRSVAFWETARLVLTSPGRLVEQVRANVELDETDCASFRRRCIFIAAFMLALAVTEAMSDAAPSPLPIVMRLVSTFAGGLVFFYFASFPLDQGEFDTPNEARRYRRIHDFVSAPLVLMIVVPFATRAAQLRGKDAWMTLYTTTGVALAVWIYYLVLFRNRVRREGRLQAVANALAIALFWGLMGFAGVVVSGMVFEWLESWLPSP